MLIRFLAFVVCFADTSVLIEASDLCHLDLHTIRQHDMTASADTEIDLQMWRLAVILLAAVMDGPADSRLGGILQFLR